MTQRAQNLILTILLLSLAAWIARSGSEEALKQAGLIAGSVLLLWRHSGRQRPEDGSSLADTLPPPGGPALPVLCLACLILGACEGPALVVGVNRVERIERLPAPIRASDFLPPPGVLATATDALVLTTKAAYSCPSGKACFWASSSDNQLYAVDAAGVVTKAQAARSFRTSTNCAGLSSPLAGDVCYDTTIPAPRWYTGAAWASLPSDALVVHLAGSETITGAKAYSAAQTFNDAVTLGDAAADVVGIKGVLRIYNTTGTYYVSLTHTATANRAVTMPDAAGAVVLDSATQTLTNKSIDAAQLTGNVAVARIAGALTTPGPIGGTTADAGTFTNLTATGTVTLTAGTLVYATVTGGAAGALGAATGYANAPGAAWSTATETVLLVAPRAGTARNLRCYLGTAPGGADTLVVTARKNAADQATTLTYTGAESGLKSDTSNTFAIAAGDRVAIKGVSSAGTAANLACSMEITN